jgi:hypothetical protein
MKIALFAGVFATGVSLLLTSGCATNRVTSGPSPAGTIVTDVKSTVQKERLFGHWISREGWFSRETSEFTFFPDGRLVFLLNGFRTGDGWDMTYTINTDTYPWEVDCLAKDINDGHINTVRLLVEMINNGYIRIGINDNPKIVPKNFTSKNVSVLILRKCK